MARVTGIEWADATWNPWVGCRKVSEGCRFCYMFRDQSRYGLDPTSVRKVSSQSFMKPLRWHNKIVFVCSWSDFFIDEAKEWRKDAWDIMSKSDNTFLLLTKRPERIVRNLPKGFMENPWPNVWLGVSVESEQYTDRIAQLITIPALTRFVSYEPALGPLDLRPWLSELHWVISGGESGFEPRSAKTRWFRAVRDDCAQFGVAYFHKQNGGNTHTDGHWGGNLLDGRVHNERPSPILEPRQKRLL